MIKLILKFIIFTGLLTLFIIFYLQEVIINYSEGITNTAIYQEKQKRVEFPPIEFCPYQPKGFKPSLLRKYKVTYTLFVQGTNHNEQSPHEIILGNKTIKDIYEDSTYKFNQDIFLYVGDSTWTNWQKVEIGENKVQFGSENKVHALNVSIRKTLYFGHCFVVWSIGETLISGDTLPFKVVTKSQSQAENDIESLAISFKTSVSNPFGKYFYPNIKENGYVEVYYEETIKTFVKDCIPGEYNMYQDFANKLLQLDLNCTNKCANFWLLEYLDNAKHELKECITPQDFFCMERHAEQDLLLLLGQLPKACRAKASNIDTSLGKRLNEEANDIKSDEFFLIVRLKGMKEFQKEYFIYDTLSMIGAIGGTLGLFVGFSFYDFFGIMIEVTDKFISKLRGH